VTEKRKWWVSWYNCFETMGPFTLFSPWWKSGFTMEEPERQTMCAALWAENEAEIEEIIYGCYDERPEAGSIEFRFMEEHDDDWHPRDNLNDRFPWQSWMTKYWDRMEYRQVE